jgi:hypothetical protein
MLKYNIFNASKRLIAEAHGIRPECEESGSCCLLHHEALAHPSEAVSEFLAERGICVLSHPTYSPDLALAEFLSHFLNKKKIATKETRFEAVSSVRQTVTGELKAIREVPTWIPNSVSVTVLSANVSVQNSRRFNMYAVHLKFINFHLLCICI